MIEPTITAEDLTLYALDLLEGDEKSRVEGMLRQSTDARKELANIRGDLALFAMGAEQHTPPLLTRQRLLKQVARERRNLPIDVPMQDHGAAPVLTTQTFTPDPVAPTGRVPQRTTPAEPQTTLQTFPSRLQQRMAASQVRPSSADGAPRITREGETASTLREPGAYITEQQVLPPEPQVFARDPQTPVASASARSVTMFEQHFAGDASTRVPEPALTPDTDPPLRRTQRRAEAVPAADLVQDHFTPSTPRDENFAFSSYRDRSEREPSHAGGIARFFAWSGWAVAAMAVVAAALALRDDFAQREQVSQQQTALSAATLNASKAEAVLQTLQSPASQRFLLARTDAAPAPGGRVAYLPERGALVFQANNLETLQPYKTYELWLIPAGEGKQPIPAGTFKPDGRGYATVVLPQLPRGMIAGNFGVTIEDEGGSTTPTLPILLVGQAV